MSDIVRETPADGVIILRINRPKKLNALSNGVISEIGEALYAAQSDGTRAIIIAGDARAFAAGADLEEFLSEGPLLAEWEIIWKCELPMIAAVRGVAFGGGLELAMGCDMMVVAEDARLGQPEIKLGLMPGAGGTQRLTRAVGKTLASEMILLGGEISGRFAYERGLANRCVPSERVEPTALDLANALAAGPPLAIKAAKASIRLAFEEPLNVALERERALFFQLLESADGREGVSAFREKRTPKWTGH